MKGKIIMLYDAILPFLTPYAQATVLTVTCNQWIYHCSTTNGLHSLAACLLTLLVVDIELMLLRLRTLPFLDHLSDVARLVHPLDVVVHAQCWPHWLGLAALHLSFCHVYSVLSLA